MTASFDLRINGGTLVDGTGAPGVAGDIGIRNGRIAAMGTISGDADRTIDASGRVVAPGFVDIHTHYDAQAFWDHSLSPSSGFGVTTIVGGNCGFSIAPLSGKADDADYLLRMLARVEGMPLESLRQGVPWDWTSFGEYLGRLENKLAINAAFMVGHSALRRAVMGERAVGHKATAEEIAAMQLLLRQSLAAGGLGLSSTISPTHSDGEGNPVPSRHAAREEFLALASVIGEFEGTTLELLPGTATAFSDATLNLMIDMSRTAGRALNWNVLAPNSRMPGVFQAQLAACDTAASRGACLVPLVTAQVNSIWVNFVSGFVLDAYPGWDALMRLSLPERKKALADPEMRRGLDESAHSAAAGRRVLTAHWPDWTFAEIHHAANKRWQGKTVGEVAQALGKAPFDTMLDIVIADDLKTSLLMPPQGADEDTWRMLGELWRSEHTVIGASDAGAHLDMIDTFASAMQVLSIGVRDRKLLSLEEAVRQLTSVPARLVGLRERGQLKVGNWADIVIFDKNTVSRGPVYTKYDLPAKAGRLYADPVGVDHVVVNGQPIVSGAKFQDAFPGKILRSSVDTYTVALPGAQ